jgi:DNA-binding MarR family transcriptional regulator
MSKKPAPVDYIRLAWRVRLICEPVCLAIIYALADGETQSSELGLRLGYSPSHLATNLAKLKLGGLVEQRRGRRQITYVLTEEGRRVHRPLARLVSDV